MSVDLPDPEPGHIERIGDHAAVMRIDDDLRRMITADTDNRRMRDAALAAGMLPLRISGAQKVAAGFTTAEEVETAATEVKKAVEKLRSVQGTGTGPVVVYGG